METWQESCGDLYHFVALTAVVLFAMRSSWEVLQSWRESHIASR